MATETEWRSRIDAAISSSSLLFHCQPIYRLGSVTPSLFEVLMRLTDPTTAEIIPAARFIHSVTDKQFKAIDKLAVISTLEHVQQAQMPHAINLSSATLNDLQFPGWLGQQLKESGVLPSMLLVELSEQSQFDAYSMQTIIAIRSLAVQAGLDDFCVGSANISSLLSVRPDFLKVDGSIVRLIAGENADITRRAIVYMTMAYCHFERIALVLEHCENGAILTQIQRMAEDFPLLKVFVQGHFELFGAARAC